MDPTPTWLRRARERQSAGRRRFFVWSAVAQLIWIGGTAAAWWTWTKVFHQPPPDRVLLAGFLSAGGLMIAIMARFGPVLPFKGAVPEEAAAAVFFSKRDVRSDDHDFEDGLQP